MPPAEEESEDSDEEESEEDLEDDDISAARQKVFLVLEDWLDDPRKSSQRVVDMQWAGIRVATLIGGSFTKQEPPGNTVLVDIYAGWSDDLVRRRAASTIDDLRLVPGYPQYPPPPHTDAIAKLVKMYANPDAPTADATPTPTPDAIADVATAAPAADDAADDDAGLASAMAGFELNDAAAKMVAMGFEFVGDGLDDAAASGVNYPETNLAAQQRPSPFSESGGGESTVTTRRGRGGDRSSRSNRSRSRSKTRKGGGASFHSSSKAALKFSAPLLNAGLVEYEQTPDQRGLILFRTASFSGTRKPGENCALDSLNFCIGDSSLVKAPDLTETSKKLYGEKEMPSFEIMSQTMRRKQPRAGRRR